MDGGGRMLGRLDRDGKNPVRLMLLEGRLYAAKVPEGSEAELLKSLDHPAIPAARLCRTGDGTLLAMEYVPGRPLSRHPGPRSQSQVLFWAVQLTDVLGYLHGRGIVHRDVKPDNIIRRPDGRLFLVDLGAARPLGDAWEGPGTVGYAAPEQYPVRGRPAAAVDGRADIYALGVTMHELLTGRQPPAAGKRPMAIRRLDPGLSPELERIVDKCTRSDPRERYQTIQALEQDLRRCRRMLRREHTLRLCRAGMLSGLALSAAAAAVNLWQEV